MTYSETLEYLYNSTPVFERVGASAYKEGLYNTIALDEHLGHPHKTFKTIHVAGTNGKGSTSHTVASILQEAGYKVGLYTSPHLVDFSERIRVNGKPVEEQYVIDFVEKHKAFFEPLHPSFFELTTAMAFDYFAKQNVDIAVIEVGLGGRLDCTNIINPILSVITNISFDHTGFLGNTLSSIAGEKAGIIKPETPVVIGEWNSETLPVFEQKAKVNNATLLLADNEMSEENVSELLPYFELKGAYQRKNLRTILAVVKELKRQNVLPDGDVYDKYVINGISRVCKNTGLRGRWEKLSDKPCVICDTGHNVGGWEYLSQQIKDESSNHENLRIVFGMVDDKDIDKVMEMLPKSAYYYFCQATTHRAIPAEVVMEKGGEHSLSGKCYQSVAEAYRDALSDSGENDFVFVGGSSYVVSDLLLFLLVE